MSKFFKDAESKNIFYSFVSLDAIPDAPVLKELNAAVTRNRKMLALANKSAKRR